MSRRLQSQGMASNVLAALSLRSTEDMSTTISVSVDAFSAWSFRSAPQSDEPTGKAKKHKPCFAKSAEPSRRPAEQKRSLSERSPRCL
jgi:hypothetical protein